MSNSINFLEKVYDVVISGGTVIDPKTETRTIANVGIIGNKIGAITRGDLKGVKVFDVTGKIVCPGFVDPHSHADGQLFSAHVMASMGVTSIIIGSCGVGPFPTQVFLKELYETGYPLNCGALVPESWKLRELAGIESPYDVANDSQIEQIADWVEQDLLQGAMGVSMGLEYAPRTSWKEMTAIAKVAAKYDKPVPIHSRAGGWGGLAATREIIRLQEETGARVLISHHVYQCGQGMMAESMPIIEKAIRQGYEIAVDSGAYGDFACPIGSEVFCEGWRDIYDCDYHDILVGTGELAGQRLTEETFQWLKERDPDASVTAFVGKPYEVVMALQQPWTMISTDGGFPNLAPGIGHPQSAGTYPKILADMVRSQDALSMMEFVRKATWMPARFFGLADKGWLGEGADADVVVFDPKTVKDNAAFPGLGDPMAAPDGIEYVLVNGIPVVEKGQLNKDARPGRAISAEGQIWRL